MTKKLLLTFALLLTAVTGAWADEYLYFEISETSATMKYGENFWGKPYYDERADWWINDSSWDGRENIKTITVDASCQNINQKNLSGLFYGFTNLETITNIDKLNTANVLDMSRLFNGCTSLTTLDLSGWNTSEVTDMSSMFYGCTSLTTLNIIGWDTSNVTNTVSMFSGCTRLASISFPASLTTIGDGAFQGCTSLATVTFAAGSQLETIGESAFNGCSGLASITIPASLTTIGDFAFQGCTDLATVTFAAGSQLETIDEGAFNGTGLTSIEIPASVTGIGMNAFADCYNLATVTFAAGSQLETIGEGAFNGTGLTSIEIPASVTGIGMNAFNGCYNLATVSFAAGSQLETIGESAFNGCSGLASITIPASVTTIGDFAFQGCTDLSSITLAEGLTTIGGYAFYNCSRTIIESVTIPESVTSIGGNAFNGTNVRKFYINNIPSKIAIGETPFKANVVTIHVFTQMRSTFENATNWSAYTGHFVEDIAISHVQSITLDNESMIMQTNTSGKLNATINPADARVKDVVFTSSNDNIIHITNAATGEFITGATEGNATITCTAMDGSGQYASCTVTVRNLFTPAESVTLNKSDMNIEVGNTLKLTATIYPTYATYKYVTWRSSDENVATVDNNGNVTAIAPGVATITAISHDGQARANCVVTVVASGSCGTGVTWTLTGTSPNYTLTISGTGAMADWQWDNSNNKPQATPWDAYKTEITSVVIGNDVTYIGAYAFYGHTALTSVTIGSSVTTIGEDAFENCSALTAIDIPANVTSIGCSAFYGCSSLVTVNGASGLTSCGSSVFSNTPWEDALSSTEVNYLGKVALLAKEGISGSVCIADETVGIADGAFVGNPEITSVIIPASVTNIGQEAFENCTSLATVTFEAGSQLATIGQSAFKMCSTLESITIPASVTTIGNQAFDNCTFLATVTFEAGSQLATIGEDAFNYCSALEAITIPAGVTTIVDMAFNNCTKLATVTLLPATPPSMGQYAFNDIGTEVTSVKNFYFHGTAYGTDTYSDWNNMYNHTGSFDDWTTTVIGTLTLSEGTTTSTAAFVSDATSNYYTEGTTITLGHGEAPEGKVFAGYTVKDANDNDVTVTENAGVYTFDMPADDVTATVNWREIIPYIDADGNTAYCTDYTVLDNTMTTISAGWYVVNDDVTISGNLSTNVSSSGEVNIILCDGATLSANNITPNGHSDNLRFYGQSQGTGTANISGDIEATQSLNIYGGTIIATNSIICRTGSVVIYGGNVTAEVIDGMYGSNFTGGTITADEIDAGSDGPIILGGATVTADRYDAEKGVTIATGITYYDGEGHVYNAGNLSTDEIEAIAGKTLRPVTGVTLTKEGDNVSATFDGTSTTTVSIPVDITVNSVTYNRTFTEGKPSTVMLPFSLSSGQTLTGGTLYKFSGVTKNNEGKWEATMTETATLQANTPYLLMPDENLTDGKVTFDLNSTTVTLNTTGGGGKETTEEGSHWTFKGTYEYMKWTTDTSDPDYNAERAAQIGKVYGFAGVAKTDINVGDFVKVASGAKIRPMGCYLLWNNEPNASRAAARGAATEELPQSITVRLVGADGEVTGIGEIDTKTGEMTFDSEAWYTLNGVRLSGKPTKKGLYINNGRKVVVK